MTTDEKLQTLNTSISEMRSLLLDIAVSKGLEDWVSQKQAERITGLGKTSLYTLRKEGRITFSKFSDKKLFYRRSDLIRYLDMQEKLKA